MMEKHSRKEDWVAVLTGTFLVALGVFFLQSANLITGGTTGLALLLSQFTPVTFGILYFIANCPFYLLAWQRFGFHFAISSAISGALVSVFADHLYLVISLEVHNEIYSAVAGGLLMGLGMLILFRHKSSLGGFNVLCLFIQDRYGISVGKTQMGIDVCILFASCFFVSPWVLTVSVLGTAVLNIVLAMNHKPTRYSVNYAS
jgi:uncharacterized membrane-anchored protein YitT (DUF2179 family)